MKGIWNCCLARLISSIIPRLSVSYNSTMCLRGLKLIIPPNPTGCCEAISFHRCVSKMRYDNNCSATHAEICTLNHLSRSVFEEFREVSICLESWWIVCCCDILLLETRQCWVFKCSIAFDEASPSTTHTLFSVKIEEDRLFICFNWGSLICLSHWGSSRNALHDHS